MHRFGWVIHRALALLSLAGPGLTGSLKTHTPQMGWNSFNHYACEIDEKIIVDNGKGLVATGLHKLGYEYVTPDCGWFSGTRDQAGALEWNITRFPNGGNGLGEKLHELGLKFGLYSGAGYWQCGGHGKYPGSLGRSLFTLFNAYPQSRWIK